MHESVQLIIIYIQLWNAKALITSFNDTNSE